MAGRTFLDKLRAFFGFAVPEPAAAEPPVLPPPAAPAPPADPLDAYGEALPGSSRKRAEEICALLEELQKRAEDRCLFEERMELQRLGSTHLPRLLRSYVDIPAEHRAEIFRETGRSASYLLNERLDKILVRLREMSRQLARDNLNAFAENIRFVDSQYGESTSPFD